MSLIQVASPKLFAHYRSLKAFLPLSTINSTLPPENRLV